MDMYYYCMYYVYVLYEYKKTYLQIQAVKGNLTVGKEVYKKCSKKC